MGLRSHSAPRPVVDAVRARPVPARASAAVQEPEVQVVPDHRAIERNRMRAAFPGVRGDDDVAQLARAYGAVRGRPGFTREIQERPFQERLFGFIEKPFSRPLRRFADQDIARWNTLVERLGSQDPALAGAGLRFGRDVPGMWIQELVARVER